MQPWQQGFLDENHPDPPQKTLTINIPLDLAQKKSILLVDAFTEAAEAFRDIARRYADSDTDMEQKATYIATAQG